MMREAWEDSTLVYSMKNSLTPITHLLSPSPLFHLAIGLDNLISSELNLDTCIYKIRSIFYYITLVHTTSGLTLPTKPNTVI